MPLRFPRAYPVAYATIATILILSFCGELAIAIKTVLGRHSQQILSQVLGNYFLSQFSRSKGKNAKLVLRLLNAPGETLPALSMAHTRWL